MRGDRDAQLNAFVGVPLKNTFCEGEEGVRAEVDEEAEGRLVCFDDGSHAGSRLFVRAY